MDPLTAIGLAGNIIQFIDYGTGIVKTAWEVSKSKSGFSNNSKTQEAVILEMKRFSSQLMISNTGQPTNDEYKALSELATQCHGLSQRLRALLGKIKAKDLSSFRQALMSAVKEKHYADEMKAIQASLDNCRDQLNLQLSWLTGYASSCWAVRVP